MTWCRPIHTSPLAAALAALLSDSSSLLAQERRLELTPLYGYQFGGGFDVAPGELDMGASDAFGFSVGVRVSDDAMAEVSYHRQDSELRFRPASGSRGDGVFDVSAEYFQGAGVFEPSDGPVKPYVAAGAGVLRLAPRGEGLETDWRFSASFGAGVKVLPDRIGFRVDFRLFVPIYDAGFSLGCAEPNVCFTGREGLRRRCKEL